jgi:hypothetical protein
MLLSFTQNLDQLRDYKPPVVQVASVKQTTHLHLLHRLMHGAIPPLSSPPHDMGINEAPNFYLLHYRTESYIQAYTVQYWV